MYRKASIFVLALLLIFVVMSTSAPETDEATKEKSSSESRLAAIEKKLDQLIEDQKTVAKKLEDMEKQLGNIESLIKTRTR